MATYSTISYQDTPAPRPGWFYSDISNVHVARDRDLFKDDYISFDTHVQCPLRGHVCVVGIGSIQLPTKTDPHRVGEFSRGTLVLSNVLHAPQAPCNIVGHSIKKDYDVVVLFGHGEQGGFIRHHDGDLVAYFEPLVSPVHPPEIRLGDPPVGPVAHAWVQAPGPDYLLKMTWPMEEVHRFEAYHHALVHGPVRKIAHYQKAMSWIADFFDNSIRFLEHFDLDSQKENHCEEGAIILRDLMIYQKKHSLGRSEVEMINYDRDFVHVFFSADENRWIFEQYGTVREFMREKGLRFWVTTDVERAAVTIQVMASAMAETGLTLLELESRQRAREAEQRVAGQRVVGQRETRVERSDSCVLM